MPTIHLTAHDLTTALHAVPGIVHHVVNQPALEEAVAAVVRQSPYGSLATSAYTLARAIVRDRPFQDGNKRAAARALQALMHRNEVHVSAHDPRLIAAVSRLAGEAPMAQEEFEAALLAIVQDAPAPATPV